MKLFEIAKEYIKPNSLDRKGVPIKLPNSYVNKNYGKKAKVRPETVTYRDTKTGTIYGRRTIHQKATS